MAPLKACEIPSVSCVSGPGGTRTLLAVDLHRERVDRRAGENLPRQNLADQPALLRGLQIAQGLQFEERHSMAAQLEHDPRYVRKERG